MSCSVGRAEPDLAALTAGEISGERLWRRLTEETDYRDYGMWSHHEGMRPGQSPHGVWHKVYLNRSLRDVLPLPDRLAPAGSVIVKESYDTDRNLTNLTVMAKVTDYSPETGDWYWAMYSPEGEILREGSPMGCVSCHGGMADNDYVIIGQLDADPGL